jgi:hypothetical protein
MIIITNKIALKNRSMLIDTLKIRWFLSVLTIFVNCQKVFEDSLNIRLLNWLNVWWFSKKWRYYKDKCKNRCRNKCKNRYKDKCENWCRCKCENWRNKDFDRYEFDWCDSSFSLRCVFFYFVFSISNSREQLMIILFHISDLIWCLILTKWFFDESIHQFSFDFLTIRMKNSIFLNVTNRVDEILNNRCEHISIIRSQIKEIIKNCVVQFMIFNTIVLIHVEHLSNKQIDDFIVDVISTYSF